MADSIRAARRSWYTPAGTWTGLHAGTGTPLLLLHDAPGEAADWADLLPLLSTHHTVFAPDRPARGARSAGRARSLRRSAAALAGLLDALALPPLIVAGHGMGGALGLALAVYHPHRVRAVAIIAAPPSAPTPARLPLETPWEQQLATTPMIGPAALRLLNPVLYQGISAWLRDAWSPAAVPPAALARAKRTWARAATLHADTLERSRWPAELAALAPQLARLSVPTPVLHGDADAITPLAAAEALRDTLPHARFGVVPGGGHMLPGTHPDELADALLRLAESVEAPPNPHARAIRIAPDLL